MTHRLSDIEIAISAFMSTATPTSPKPMRRKGSTRRNRAVSHLPPQQTQESHDTALQAIRTFLRGRRSYDVFPLSSRVIVLDTKLEVKKALICLLNNGIYISIRILHSAELLAGVVSAPLWNSERRSFAGMLTVSDIIHLIQYYYFTVNSYETAAAQVEEFRLESLRGELFKEMSISWYLTFVRPADIERTLNVPPPPLLSINPMQTLYDASKMLIKTHARRLPLLDCDSQTGDEVVISVLTQYRLLKFIAINVSSV